MMQCVETAALAGHELNEADAVCAMHCDVKVTSHGSSSIQQTVVGGCFCSL